MVSAPPFLGGPNSFEGSYFWGDLQKSKKDGGTCSFWGDLKIFHYGGTYYSVVSLFSVMLRLFVIVIKDSSKSCSIHGPIHVSVHPKAEISK